MRTHKLVTALAVLAFAVATDGPAEASPGRATSPVIQFSTATFGAHIQVGDTSSALFGPGLTAPQGADIHLVVCDGTQFSPSCAVQFAAFEA